MSSMSTLETERRAALSGALLRHVPELGALIITGGDRLAWLNGLVTCDLAGKKPGAGLYGLAVGKTGKIMAEVWIVVAKDHLVVGIPADRLELVREHFEKHLIMEDVEIAVAHRRGWLTVHGPLAEELLGVARELGADAARVDFTGRGDAVAILAPPDQLEAVRDALLARAGERGALSTPEGWEALRIEGCPRPPRRA